MPAEREFRGIMTKKENSQVSRRTPALLDFRQPSPAHHHLLVVFQQYDPTPTNGLHLLDMAVGNPFPTADFESLIAEQIHDPVQGTRNRGYALRAVQMHILQVGGCAKYAAANHPR